jgi:glycosyltransferase involved in cell wall biosynthesis
MSTGFSIVMPAYRATETIHASVRSVLAQEFGHLEVLIISDDGIDYEAVLWGLTDPRLRFLSTGGMGTGSANARNVGLDAAQMDMIAILDADDRFLPGKLSRFAEALKSHALVSCALSVTSADGTPLRTVGAGMDKVLTGADYKTVNISMDSMIAYDRRVADPRYDRDQPCLTDLDLLLKLFAGVQSCFHIGVPLHQYVKQSVSISNGPGVAERMIDTKKLILGRLGAGTYGLSAEAASGFARFLETSLEAEKSYEAALSARPGLLFEDHLEAFLAPPSGKSYLS